MNTFDPALFLAATSMTVRQGIAPWFILPVAEHQAALLLRRGRVVAELAAGVHRRFGRGWSAKVCDLRPRPLILAGQELLTADRNTVKVSLLLEFAVADVRTMHAASAAPEQALHHGAQIVLRALVAAKSLDDLLDRKAEDEVALTAALAPVAMDLGFRLQRAAIRDLMLPAELKRAYAAVVAAREDGKAALERARGEHAALRSLANAARLLEEHPALVQLKSLQALIDAAAKGGSTFVLGDGVLPLTGGKRGPRAT